MGICQMGAKSKHQSHGLTIRQVSTIRFLGYEVFDPLTICTLQWLIQQLRRIIIGQFMLCFAQIKNHHGSCNSNQHGAYESFVIVKLHFVKNGRFRMKELRSTTSYDYMHVDINGELAINGK